MYFYLQRGMTWVNEFKYVAAGIFAVYYTLKLDNHIFIPLADLVVIPVLTVSGWVYVHWIAKPIDWLNIEYATYWQRYSFSLQEKQNELIEKVVSLSPAPRKKTVNKKASRKRRVSKTREDSRRKGGETNG